jgi:hypothetical protein
MKKLFLASSLLVFSLLTALPAAAQTPTVVSGTVTDVNGVPYSFAKVSAQLIPTTASPTIIVNGIPTQIGGQQNANADGNGTFSMNLFCNTAGGGCSVISPSGTQWQITVNMTGIALPLGTGQQTFSVTVTITGTSQSVSAQLNAVAPALSIIPKATLQPQFVSSAAFPAGTIPTGTTGTVIFNGTPTSFTFSGSPCMVACDGQTLTFFVFPQVGNPPYSIAGTLGQNIFTSPTMGPADKLTFPSVLAASTFEYRGGTLFYIGGNGFTPSFSGIAGPPVGSAVNDFYLNASANGAIDFYGPQAPAGSVFITKGSAALLTLINPAAGPDDGKTVTIVSTTAFAHTITTGANGINGSLHIATFGAAVGNFIVFKAFNGSWWVVGNTGVALT